MTAGRRPEPRSRPHAREEILAVWLVDRAGELLSTGLHLLAFRRFRGRDVKRRYLGSANDLALGNRRTEAISDVGRFLIDPAAFAAPDPGASAWPLGGLADDEVGWIIRAQAHAVAGRHHLAVRCMGRALRLLMEPDRTRPRGHWLESFQVRAENPRSQQARHELEALVRMFIAGELMSAGRPRAALVQAGRACESQPGTVYLHEVRADLAYEAGRYADVLEALDRAAALQGANTSADPRFAAAVLGATAAFQAVHWADAPDAAAWALVPRALARLDALAPDTVRSPRRLDALYWRALLLLERARAGGADGAADTAQARARLEAVVRLAGEDEADHRARAAAWLPLARGKPWRALHERLGRPDTDWTDAVAVGLRTQAGAGSPAPRHRLAIRYPDSTPPDEARSEALARRLIGQEGAQDPGDDATVPSLAALDRLLLARYGLSRPAALLQRITNAPSQRVDVVLDGAPLGTAEVDWSDPAGTWFDRPVRLQPDVEDPDAHPGHIVLVVARMVLQHLDRLLDAGHVKELGLEARSYRAWSPTLRLLLADRTPLTERAALHAAVASVDCGAATPLLAAERYRALPALRPRLWGVGDGRADHLLPASLATALTACIPAASGQGATDVPDRLARDIEDWATAAATKGADHARVVVDDPALRPWLRALLRPRHPDLPVLARQELDPT